MSSSKKSKNVFWLGLTSFFTDISSEMIFPILPIFLTTVLHADMAIIGLIEGIAESASSFLKLASGWLSDKFKRKKPLIITGYSLSALTKPLLVLATSWWYVLAVRVSDRLGKGIRTAPRDALIAASVNKKEKGRYFGLHRAMDTAGAVVGTIIAFYIMQTFMGEGFRIIFWLSLIPGIIAVAVLIFAVREHKADIKKKISISFRNLSRDARWFMVISAVFGFANLSYAFFLLRAQNIGMAIAIIPLLYLVYNLFYAFFAIPAGRLSDRFGRKNVLVCGILLFSLTSIGFAFVANIWLLWVLFAFYGMFMAVTDAVSRAYVTDLSKKEMHGSTLGAYHMIIGIVDLPANIVAGFLWQTVSVQTPFIVGGVLSLVAAVMLVVLVKK